MVVIRTGPRGGQYYMKGGKKVYLKKEEKKSKRGPKKGQKSKSRGSSNKGNYPRLHKQSFCGPAGGASARTYPVNTPRRAVSALAYSRNAPNPEGLRNCVYAMAKRKGWYDEKTGRIRIGKRK